MLSARRRWWRSERIAGRGSPITKREIKTNENWSISWKEWEDKTINFSEIEKIIINKTLKDLDIKWKVTEQHIELFNIFK